jgi:hypothetical protein
VALLRTLDAKPDLMLQKVELSLQRHDADRAMEQFPVSPASKRVFTAAQEEAGRFHHQLIGPEHLLLGLMREHDAAEAAQILFAHGLTLDALWAAVAELPADRFREAQFQTHDRAAPGDNPSVDELERWIAPPMTVEPEIGEPQVVDESHPASPAYSLDFQLRVTQLALGGVIGYTFGHWLSGWMMGTLMAAAGIGVAAFRNSWIGVFAGVLCGLFITPLFHDDHSAGLVGLLGGFLGSFLGDAWRYKQPTPESPVHETASPEEPEHEEEHIQAGASNKPTTGEK